MECFVCRARRIPEVLRLVPPHIPLTEDRILTTRIATAMERGDEAGARAVWREAQVCRSACADQAGSTVDIHGTCPRSWAFTRTVDAHETGAQSVCM